MTFRFPALSAPSAALGGALLLASITTPSSAQSRLDPIVVTATREPQALASVAADVVLIDAERIRQSTADSIEDLLRREAGLQIVRNGGPGQNASVLMRGASAGSTVVLIDGVRVGSATVGQVEFESISLSQIERIEVLRGPGSSLYGADAVGGVVQIFTRRGEGAPRFTASGALGGERSRQGSLAVSGASGAIDYAAALGRESSRGVSALKPGDQFGSYNPDRDGFTRDTAQLQLGVTPLAGHRVGLNIVESRLNAQYDASDYAQPDPAAPDFRNKLRSSVAALDYRGVLSPAWTTSAQLSHNEDDLKSGAITIDRFRTRREQFTGQAAWTPRAGQQLVVAYEHRDEHADTAVYDEKRRNDALVLGYSGQFGAHSVQADLRRDQNSVYGGETTGRLGWSLEFAPGWRMRALAGTTFRAPSFNELFYPDYGVRTITPERGRSIELGLNWRAGDSEAAATVYQNRVRDLIVYQPDQAACSSDTTLYQFGCAANIGRVRLQGVTLSGAQRWGAWRFGATLDFLDAKDLVTGDRLARRAAHQESLNAAYEQGAWRVGAALLSVGARPEGSATLAAYTTLDLSARWRFAPQWQLEAKLLNATGRQYEPARDYQGVGRQAWIGVRYDSRGL